MSRQQKILTGQILLTAILIAVVSWLLVRRMDNGGDDTTQSVGTVVDVDSVDTVMTDDTEISEEGGEEPLELKESAIQIAWSEPVEIPLTDEFGFGEALDEIRSVAFEVGKVTAGEYADGRIILVGAWWEDALQMYESHYRFLQHDGSLFLIENYSDNVNNYSGLEEAPLRALTRLNISLPDLDFPTQALLYDNRILLTLDEFARVRWDERLVEFAVESDDLGRVYTTSSSVDFPVAGTEHEEYMAFWDQYETGSSVYAKHGFYVKAPDGTTRVYRYEPDFFNDGGFRSHSNGIPVITWTDGVRPVRNYEEYLYTSFGGCGAVDYVSVVNGEVSLADMVQIGELTVSGDPIYRLRDTSHSLYTEFFEYNQAVSIMDGESGFIGSDDYAVFIGNRPLIFWEDPAGQIVKMSLSKYIPPAECGKPVIYLYPEETTELDVKVNFLGDFTVTIPKHGDDGWSVVANPDGSLVNKADGQAYPYLFWEGNSDLVYDFPRQGFTYAADDLEEGLYNLLAWHGLNQIESDDFMEFWLPLMLEKDYEKYFVSFFGNDLMNAMAPLEISEEPDTLIRIFMEWGEYDGSWEVEPYAIRTPVREGFTVVEWGGTKK